MFFLFISCDSYSTEKIVSLDEAIISLPKWYNDYKSAISFVWDDNNKDHYIKIGTIFNQFNLNCSFAIITNHLNQESIRGYKNLLSNNHELLSHSVNHVGADLLNNEQILYEMRESKNTIIELFDIIPISYIHPGNGTNKFYNTNLHNYYLYSRIYNLNQDSLNFIANIGTATDLNRFKYISQLNKELENWVVIAGHGVDGYGWEPITSDDLYYFLQFLNQEIIHG